MPISSGPAAGISLAYLCPDLAAWLRQGVGGLPPLFCPSQFAMPAKGVTFRYPFLPWDGVASSHPTDATICRTGTAVAPCDNGAATDPLAGSPKFGRSVDAASCPKLGRLPAGVIGLQNAAPLAPEMLTFTNISVLDLRFLRFSHRCDRLCRLPNFSATSPVVQMMSAFPRSLRPLAGPVVGFTLWGCQFPSGVGFVGSADGWAW